MNFDIRSVPFSRYGSPLAFSRLDLFSRAAPDQSKKHLVWLRDVVAGQAIFSLEMMVDGVSVPYEVTAFPAMIELRHDQRIVRLCIAEDRLVRVMGEGAGLRLTMANSDYSCAVCGPGETWLLNSFSAGVFFAVTPLEGSLRVDAPWVEARCEHVVVDLLPGVNSHRMEGALEEFEGSWTPRVYTGLFDEHARRAGADFVRFASAYPETPQPYASAATLAAYINWSCVLSPAGFLARPGMLMSKNWMCNVWSWDHCFNAMALAGGNPELAWHQLLVMFDQQLENGQLPDFISPRHKITNFVKPPIHGWALQQMVAANPGWFDRTRLAEFYRPLARLTEWWFAYRDVQGDGLPEYYHGNDSGWDNGTVFDPGFPVKGCDLAAFLVIQMDTLSWMAQQLGRASDAESWRRRADALLERMLARLWDGQRFVSLCGPDQVVSPRSDSVFNCLPILLGKRLPSEVREKIVAQIRRFVTAHGPATEHPESPLYQPDGYWRGPIWAPSTMILVDGLKRAGENEFAAEIARRFCDTANQQGFAENYDALTGEGLRDRAYTWTSSVFLLLASQYL